MGWLFSIFFLTLGFSTKDPLYFVAAGLFAIAGAIAFKS